MESNDKKEYIDSIHNIIFQTIDIDNNILYNLIDALCSIAIFDWPEEYQNFSELFYLQNDQRIDSISLKIISTFFEKIDESSMITDLRKNNLRQFIIENFRDQLILIITDCLTVTDFSNYVLDIFNCIFRWDSIDDIIDFDLFQNLTLQLLPNEITSDKTIKFFNSIFLLRIGITNPFSSYSPFLIDSLTKLTYQDQKPVTSNPNVIKFLIRYLEEYSWVLEIVLIYDQIKGHDMNEPLINGNVELIVKAMQESDISFSTFHDDLLYLYHIILSIPPEDIVDDLKISFWNLWQKNLLNVVNEQQRQDSIVSSSSFFLPFFEDITISLFNSLISFTDDKEDNFYQMESILKSIYTINSEDYIEFLKIQSPSPQLCYAIAAFEFHLDDSKLEGILMLIVDLFEYINSDKNLDAEFQSEFLYGLSHCAKFVNENSQLFTQFIDLIFSSMAENEEVVSYAATYAFKYIVTNHIELFRGDFQYLIDQIISQNESILLNMDTKSSKRVFKTCTILINNLNEDIQILYEKLFEPILIVFEKIEQYQQDIIEKALEIVSKCFRDSSLFSPESDTYSPELFDHFYRPLFQLATTLVPDLNAPSSLIERILCAIGTIQLKLDIDQISSQINELFELMKNRERIEDGFFTYFLLIRTTHEEIDSMYQSLYEELIDPYLSNEETASIEMFNMISKFSPDVVDIEWLTEIVFESVKNSDKNVSQSGLDAYLSILSELNENLKLQFLSSLGNDLITTLIEAIIDLIHKPLFRSLVNILRSILTLIDLKDNDDEKIQNLRTELLNLVANSLKQRANEPQDGFFDDFSEYLSSILNSRFEFFDAFSNLLVVLRKASPCDIELFKVV